MDQTTHSLLHAVDLFGTASFAFSGALRAIDRRPDFVGMVILAGATAVGGGLLRDLILQRQTSFLIAMLLTTGIRCAAIHYDWRLPRLLSIHAEDVPNPEPGLPSTDSPRRNA